MTDEEREERKWRCGPWSGRIQWPFIDHIKKYAATFGKSEASMVEHALYMTDPSKFDAMGVKPGERDTTPFQKKDQP